MYDLTKDSSGTKVKVKKFKSTTWSFVELRPRRGKNQMRFTNGDLEGCPN